MTDKEKRILNHVQNMSVLVTCMEIEVTKDLIDYRFRDPNTNNHVRRLKESLQQIKKGLSFKFKVTDREFMEYEHGSEMHRAFEYFSTMDTNQLRSLLDGFDELERRNKEVTCM